MAGTTIETYQTDRGAWRYRVRYRNHLGQAKSETFRAVVAAEDRAEVLEVDLSRAEAFDVRPGKRTTFAAVAEDWLTSRKVAPRTRANLRSRLDRHVLPALGHLPVASVNAAAVEALVRALEAKGLGADSIHKCHQVVVAVLKRAERDGLVRHAPKGVELPSAGQPAEMMFLDAGQVATLADAIDPRYRVAVLFAAFTGLRAGEQWALRPDRLDLLRGEVRVSESLYETAAANLTPADRTNVVVNGLYPVVVGPTKTRASRTVGLPGFLCEALGEHTARYPGEWVFTAPDGGPVRHRNFSRRTFALGRQAAGLDGLRWHDLRHTTAALLIARRHSLLEVSRHLGHAKIEVTAGRYGHLFDDARRSMAASLDDAFAEGSCVTGVSRAPVVPLRDASQAPG